MNFSYRILCDVVLKILGFIGNRYWIDFSKWEVFVNDDRTRTFLSIEVITGGLAEVLALHFILS